MHQRADEASWVFRSVNGDAMAGLEKRPKKRNAAQMIDMTVRKKDVELEWGSSLEQPIAERPDAGPGIENQPAILGQDFHTGGVSAIALMAWTRTGNGTAHAVKKRLVHGTNL